MSYRAYTPERGDIIHLNSSPSAGHEMAGRHYALVVSATSYNKRAKMALVCPITSRVRGWPFEVKVPAGLLPAKRNVGEVSSVIITDAVRQMDFRQRDAEFIAKAPKDIVEQVVDMIFATMEPD